MANTIDYKHLKEGDIITCEVAGYDDFWVGQRCKVLKDGRGISDKYVDYV